MKAIIVGAGKVGFKIAEMLSMEKHDVVVIEEQEDRVNNLSDSLDVQIISGNGASPSVLEAAGVRNANLMIAVTESDELNMIACQLAKQFGARTTVARVRNPEYTSIPNMSPKLSMGVDLFINPEQVTAVEIAKVIQIPEALNVEYYASGKVQLIELNILQGNPIVGMKLKELGAKLPYTIVSIIRNQQTIIPNGNTILNGGDRINVMAKTEDMISIKRLLGIQRPPAENITILGGGRTGYYLSHILENSKKNIKIIEKDPRRARAISNKLNNTLVLNGDGTDVQLLEDENIGDSDVFVAVTDDDKINLLCSLIAKNLGAKKTVAKVGRSEIIPLIKQVGVDVVFSPRILTAGAILKYIRRGNIVSVTLLNENRAQMIELIAQPGIKILNKKLKDIDFPSGAIIGAIKRGDDIFIANGDNYIRENDHLMIYCLPNSISKIDRLFSSGV